MSELISGKEALIALANGEEVEFKRHVNNSAWLKAKELKASEILNHCMVLGINNYSIEFRLKPRTVYLNGIEVLKPQKDSPKKGDDVFILDFTNNVGGFTSWKCQNSINTFSCEWWRTEEEIKQVVAALRSIFK